MIIGIVEPPVSRATGAGADKHCGANIYQASSKDSAIAGSSPWRSVERPRYIIPVAESAYTVRSALTGDEADVFQLVRTLRRRGGGYDMTGDRYVADHGVRERHGLGHQR